MKQLIIILLFASVLVAGDKTFSWNTIDGMCYYTASYDDTIFSEKQIADTYKLLNFDTFLYNVTTTNPENIEKFSVQSLDQEYKTAKQVLTTLEVVNLPFWNKIKQKRLNELNDVYNAKRITLLSYTDPKALLDSVYNTESNNYAIILNSDDETILGAWYKLKEEQKKNNGSPENLEKEYQEKLNSPQKMIHAKLQLTTYGWWNSINSTIRYVDPYEEKLDENFLKLFTKIISKECDTP